jgi:protein-S-isoprenylcysteine O-methyltransferase Ste14
MSTLIFKIVYLAGLIAQIAIRAPFDRQRRKEKVATDKMGLQESILLGLLFLGNFFLPMIYIFTPWLSFADYTLPDWAGWLGIPIIVAELVVFWRAHVDLGKNWSPTLQLREGHSLITNGLYQYIRHPMYASQWLWIMAQPLLLQNWIAGVLGALLFLPMYFVRVPQEEKMMLEQFGEEYRAYMQRTGRVLPPFGK